MMKKEKTLKGSCLCGMVTFTLKGPYSGPWFCHCTQCRKNYGLYGAFIGVLDENAKIKNPKAVRWYHSSKEVKRGFCKTCGSPIVWKKKNSTHTFFLPGLIDGKTGVKKGTHIFVKNKGDYYTLHT